MADLRFHRLVASDLADAIEWYDERSEGLGDRFRAAVSGRLDEIAEKPSLFPRAFDDADYQFARLSRFPYLVLYRVRRETVLILGVFHSASDPAKWHRRGADAR